MKKRKSTSVIALILVALMLLSLIAGVIPILAHADQDSDFSKTLETLQGARDAITAQISNASERIEKLKEEKSAVLEQKMALEERNACALEELIIIDKEIALYKNMIEEKAKEVDAAREREAVQLEKYRARVRAMEENGRFSLLSIIVHSESFAELLAAIDDYATVMKSDRELSRRYEAARRETESILAEYEENREEFEAKQAELEKIQEELSKQIAESQQLIEELDSAIEEAEEEKRKAEEAEAAAAASVDAFIRDYMARRAKAAAEAAAQSAGQSTPSAPQGGESSSGEGEYTYPTEGEHTDPSEGDGEEQFEEYFFYGDGPQEETQSGGSYEEYYYDDPSQHSSGGFIWPVPSSHRISSTYKYRWGKQHTGVDIDGFALEGYPIVAADGGTVIMASYNGGYGNCVIIDHGNGYMTLYGHMSGFAVYSGQSVSQGQTIGYLGNTGNSFGTHCHFEIMTVDASGNSTKIDPLPFLSGYELEPGAAD